ncbi:thiS family protein [Lyngbya aestuarii BL J]|uniref:Molybdopterin synthase sulfur carrier subunit n=1 Tax=Lyngbya aestuarii BL J TaxID=1348334 RepID=U7QKN6_9CYAN|nr:MoaD/ThiS family protein [Lyngbya aestuarii]ERT07675.1 thiS family protein [Lyngbya aestuarii BL J]
MSNLAITVTVQLFAVYQEVYKVPKLVLTLPPQTPVSQVLEHCIEEHPELERWRPLTHFGVNLQFVPPETPLSNGDEVVLIPPVSGG